MTHVDLRLRADDVDFWVDVHLHRFDVGWLAVADLAGDAELGWGYQPTAAIAWRSALSARPHRTDSWRPPTSSSPTAGAIGETTGRSMPLHRSRCACGWQPNIRKSDIHQ